MMMAERAADLIRESAALIEESGGAIEEPADHTMIDAEEIILSRGDGAVSIADVRRTRASVAARLDGARNRRRCGIVVDSPRRRPTRSGPCTGARCNCSRSTEDDPAAEPIDVITPGGTSGSHSLLTGESVQFTARTQRIQHLIRLPGQPRPAGFTGRTGAVTWPKWSSVQSRGTAVRYRGAFARRPVGELLHSDPVLVSTDTSVRDAVGG